MFCPICGAKIEEGERECAICGHVVEYAQEEQQDSVFTGNNRCPNCGFAIGEGDVLCPICNTEVTYVASIVEDTLEELQSENTVVEEGQTASQESKKTILIISVIFLVLLIGGLAFWFLSGSDSDKGETKGTTVEKEESKGSNSGDEKAESVEGESGQNSEEKMEDININNYVGYWNISQNANKELTIHNGNDDTVYFSLWYRKLDEISNVAATMKDNVATFSVAVDGAAIKGTLTFHKEAITVQITHSGRVNMPIEIMEFTERHMTSWVYSQETSYESTDIYTNSYEGTEISEYILPFSSDRLLVEEDLYLLTLDELRLARNEIYARHGRKFNDEAMQAYFNAKQWYFGYIEPANFSESMLSEIERANVQFIQSHEQ